MKIFFHCAQISNKWQSIRDEILSAINEAGLPAPEIVNIAGADLKRFEFPTLKRLWDYCRDNPGDQVLYLHTKGVSKPAALYQEWRRWMLWGCVTRYKECLELLKTHDAIGCDWINGPPVNDLRQTMDWGNTGFFPGNFWWANASYIATLPDPATLDQSDRYRAEAWIGMNPAIKHASIHSIAKSRSNGAFCQALQTLSSRDYDPPKITVVTALSRHQNLDILQGHLEPANVNWVLLANKHPRAMPLWARVIVTPDFTIGDPFYRKLNHFLDHPAFDPEQYYVVLNDDDLFHPTNYWPAVKQAVRGNERGTCIADIICTSMWHSPEQHLTADPGHMVCGQIGVEQLVVKGSIWGQYRYEENLSTADFEIIAKIYHDHMEKVRFLPDADVIFNCLPPHKQWL